MNSLVFVFLFLSLFKARLFGAKIVLFSDLATFFAVFCAKKRRPQPPFLINKVLFLTSYFTMNFWVFSKPLAFTVTK